MRGIGTRDRSAVRAFAAAAVCILGALIRPALADEPAGERSDEHGRLTVIEENDAFPSSDDRHYTQGLRISYLSAPIRSGGFWDRPFTWAGDLLPIFGEDGGPSRRKIDWTVLGQSLFTPANLRISPPDRTDRPYAGWLYTGVGLLQDHDARMLENLELLAGVVGPSALGKQTQNDFHDFIRVGEAHGWGYQLHDEPGLMLSYERKWRFELPLLADIGVDAIPEAGVTLGNVMTYGAAGATLRFGQNLRADYGPAHIRPSLSGSGWFDADRMDFPLGWYVFVGVQGRAVAHNIFLDGNTWQDSRHVDRKPLVADLVWGASVFLSDAVKLDFAVTDRTKEYYGQPFKDRFGMIGLSVRFW